MAPTHFEVLIKQALAGQELVVCLPGCLASRCRSPHLPLRAKPELLPPALQLPRDGTPREMALALPSWVALQLKGRRGSGALGRHSGVRPCRTLSWGQPLPSSPAAPSPQESQHCSWKLGGAWISPGELQRGAKSCVEVGREQMKTVLQGSTCARGFVIRWVHLSWLCPA